METKEDLLAIQLLLSMLEISPHIEKLNTWMLAGTGATAAVIVSNISNIQESVKEHTCNYLLASLAISMLFGLTAKLFGAKAQTSKTMINNILGFMNQHPDTNILMSLESYISAFPFWAKIPIRKGAQKGTKDPLWGYKKAANFIACQSAYTTLQGIMIIAFIVIASISIK